MKNGWNDCIKGTVPESIHNNLNVSNVAKALFIHRNTMVYRLEKLQDLTGLSTRRFLGHGILCKSSFAESFREISS